jgi:hypothetical protein
MSGKRGLFGTLPSSVNTCSSIFGASVFMGAWLRRLTKMNHDRLRRPLPLVDQKQNKDRLKQLRRDDRSAVAFGSDKD